MEIVILEKKEDVAKEVARRIVQLIKDKPNAVLGLATGNTMISVYRELIDEYKKGNIDFSHVTSFNLDEYLGIFSTDPYSFRFYMQKNLFNHINIKRENTFLPPSLPDNIDEECRKYEELIKQRGGIDLQLLGIGRNGHIGFNEPSSSLSSRTRVKTLTEETVKVNFPEGKGIRYSITMGIGTIMEAKEIILVATGKEKAKAIKDAIEGPISATCPASVLQLHEKAVFILDKEAAQLLEKKDYYIYVYRNKSELEKKIYFERGISRVKAPARVCLFGEHQDYLGLPVISAAVNIYMRAVGEKINNRKVWFSLPDIGDEVNFELNFPLKYESKRDYLRSIFNVLKRMGFDFDCGFRFFVSSEIPINAGASSSTAFVVSVVKLILELLDSELKDELLKIAEISHEAEVLEFKEPGGMMDHYTCSLGGVLFMDFKEKKIEVLRKDLDGIVVSNSLVPKRTIEVLERARELQTKALEELKKVYDRFDVRKTDYKTSLELLEKIPVELKKYGRAAIENYELTKKGKEILKKDKISPTELGELLNKHQAILRDLLEVSHPVIDDMLREAIKAGAYGGKINGSGSGGTLIVYAPGKENEVIEVFKKMGKPSWKVKVSEGVFSY